MDSQMSFLALAIASKKTKTASETCAKWLQFGAVSETRSLAFSHQIQVFTQFGREPWCCSYGMRLSI